MKGICTVWLAFDKATKENGCMAVIPGSQRGGFSKYEEAADKGGSIFATQIKAGSVDESQAVYFALKPNECSLHEARIMHGAQANTSPLRRAGYTMRHFPTSTAVSPERNAGHKIWLARRVELAGNRYENA